MAPKINKTFAKVSTITVIADPADSISVGQVEGDLQDSLGIACLNIATGPFDQLYIYMSEDAVNKLKSELYKI